MKYMKKLSALLLALIMVLSLTAGAAAQETETTYTITIENPATGHIYEAYQIFVGDISDAADNDAVADTKAVLSNIKWGKNVDKKAETELGDASTYAETITDAAAFATTISEYLTGTPVTSTAGEGKYTISGLAAGYYLIKDRDGSVSGHDAYTRYIIEVVEASTVKPKADAPTLDKKIDENGIKVDANNGSIGDTVNYELTSKVPAMDGYNKYFFIIHDTMSDGLTFDATSVKVKIGEGDLAADQYQVITEGLTDGCTFEIILKNFIQYKDKAGQTITVTYSATIDEDAVIGNTGNPNEAKLEYSNNPNVDSNGTPENPDIPDDDDVTGETPKDTVITYVTAIELVKVDQDGNRLTGAEFQITGEKLNKVKVVTETFEQAADGTYYALRDGSYTETEPTEQTTDKYVDGTTKYKKNEVVIWNTETEDVSAIATVGPDGVLRFEGLAEGTYTITEIKAPAGYNMLTQPITVVITCNERESIDSVNDPAEWKYALSGAISQSEVIAEDGVIHITVENKAGATLPETGGMGTTLFYIVGGILVLAAVVLLVTKKRMSSAE